MIKQTGDNQAVIPFKLNPRAQRNDILLRTFPDMVTTICLCNQVMQEGKNPQLHKSYEYKYNNLDVILELLI